MKTDDLQYIQRRYNPDFDLMPGAPPVTWAEYTIAYKLIELNYEVETLRDIVKELRQEVKKLTQAAS